MNRIKHSADFQISKSAQELFPLFSAEGEKHWVPGWDYINVMGSATLHEDYVFVTQHHDHGSHDAIWLVKKHDPEKYYVEFYKVEPGDKVGIISVQCDAQSSSSTQVTVTYEYIALSESGAAFIETFTAEDYRVFIGEWKLLLDEYFKN